MKKLQLLPFLFLALFLASCGEEDDPEPAHTHDHEAPTKIKIMLEDSTGHKVEMEMEDEDGPGGKAPEKSVSDSLKANTLYNGTITLYSHHEHDGHHHDYEITGEVEKEGDTHIFVFEAHGSTEPTFAYKDTDKNGKPIGLKFSLQTGNAGAGHMHVKLKHGQVNKDVALTDPDKVGGGTDIDAEFDYVVK